VTGTNSPLQSLPRSGVSSIMKIALVVVKELGVHFLWVDQYCINQDDAATKDDQINKMHSIYEGSIATIVAAAGQDADHGLSGCRASY
jgi:hypothetical protein